MRVAIDLIHRRRFAGILSHPPSPYFSKLYSTTIDFSCVKEIDDAIHLFQEMVRMRPQSSLLVYNKLLSVTVKMKEYSFALYVFDEMRQRAAPVNDYTMNIAINCYCLLKCVDLGFAIMGIFFESGQQPDVTTFNTLIQGLFLDDKVVDAVKLFKKLLVFGICKPNDVMILAMIDGLRKSRNVIAASDLFRRLERKGWKPNVKTYSALLNGLCKGGMVDDAFLLLSKMINKGISPNVVTYSSMIQGLCDAGRLKDVKDLVNEMVNSNISLNDVTFYILIDAFCKEEKMKEAEDVLHSSGIKFA